MEETHEWLADRADGSIAKAAKVGKVKAGLNGLIPKQWKGHC